MKGNSTELVSVIIPVYNVERYLSQCISSITEQTYSNLEIILVDDGSTDSSGLLCDNLATMDKRINVYHKANEGLGLTRNYGMIHAHGKYVVFVDSDDYIEKDAIRRMVKIAVEENADLIVEGFRKVTNSGEVLYVETYKEEIFEKLEVKDLFLPRMIGSLPGRRDSIFTTVCSKLYLLETIKKNGVLFCSEREIQSEDLAFQLDCVPFFQKVIVTPNSGYFYRYNPTSLSTTYKTSRFHDAKKVHQYVINKIEHLDIPRSAIFRADKNLFVLLKSIFSQEVSPLRETPWRYRVWKVRGYMKDEYIQKVVRGYPIEQLNLKQKIFVILIKNKSAMLTSFILRFISI